MDVETRFGSTDSFYDQTLLQMIRKKNSKINWVFLQHREVTLVNNFYRKVNIFLSIYQIKSVVLNLWSMTHLFTIKKVVSIALFDKNENYFNKLPCE